MIEIIKGDTGYLARFSGKDKPEIVKLFGGDTLPTGFTLANDIWTVAEKIQNLNPDKNVIVY